MESKVRALDQLTAKDRPTEESRAVEAIENHVRVLSKEKFTGEVVFRLNFNQGGIRNGKVTIEKPL